jgi:hypothetical protein
LILLLLHIITWCLIKVSPLDFIDELKTLLLQNVELLFRSILCRILLD